MRAALVCHEFPPEGGGAASACAALAAAGAAIGHEIHVIAGVGGASAHGAGGGTGCRARSRSERGKVPTGPAAEGFHLHSVHVRRHGLHESSPWGIARFLLGARRLLDALEAARPFDLRLYYFAVPAGALLLARPKRPGQDVVWLRGSDVPGYDRAGLRRAVAWLKPVLGRILGRADRVLALSESLRSLAARSFPGIPIEVLGNGVDLEAFRPADRPPSAPPVRIVSVARLVERKGLADLLEALAGLPDLPWELSIAGDGPGRAALEALAGRLGIAARVRFLGALAPGPVASLLRGSHLFALPSRVESFGQAIAEAMAAGLPVAACRAGSVPELLGPAAAARLPAPGDVPGLAAAIRRLLADGAARAEEGRRNREEALARFRWDRIAGPLLGEPGPSLKLHRRPPRISIFALRAPDEVSGEFRSLHDLGNALEEGGARVELSAHPVRIRRGLARGARYSFRPLFPWRWRPRLLDPLLPAAVLAFVLRAARRARGADAVIVDVPLPSLAFLGDLIARLSGTPAVVRLGLPAIPDAFAVLRDLASAPWRYAARLLANSEAAARVGRARSVPAIVSTPWQRDQLVRLGWDAARVHVIPNGIALPLPPPPRSPSPGREGEGLMKASVPVPPSPEGRGGQGGEGRRVPTVAYLGHLKHPKGVFDLLEALRDLAEQGAAFRFDVAHPGTGTPRRFFREAARLGLSDRITAYGVVDPSAFLATREIAVLPYRHAFGTHLVPSVLLEAFAAGIPVVTTSVEWTRGILEDGVHALLAPPGDPLALAAAIGRLLGDPALRSSLAEHARRLIADRFDARRNAGTLAALILPFTPALGAAARTMAAR